MNIKTGPSITVLMSVHNNCDVVDRAISSILNQSYGDFEFLIIDDSSTDNTSEIIDSYDDTRIRILKNDKNLGLTKSLNRGLKEARGKYIARIDADDTSHPDRLGKQVGFLEENPDFLLLGTSFNIVNKKDQLIREVVFNTTPEKLYYDLMFQNMIAHSSAFFRLKAALEIGGYDEKYRYAQDYNLWLRLSKVGRIWILPEVLTDWCDDPKNISSRNEDEQDMAARSIFEANLRKIGVEEDMMADTVFLQNYYNREFTEIPGDKIYRVFSALLYINDKIVSNYPEFYNKAVLSDIAYQNIADLLTRIFKETHYKSRVTAFLTRNIFNLRLDKKILMKAVGIGRKRT